MKFVYENTLYMFQKFRNILEMHLFILGSLPHLMSLAGSDKEVVVMWFTSDHLIQAAVLASIHVPLVLYIAWNCH